MCFLRAQSGRIVPADITVVVMRVALKMASVVQFWWLVLHDLVQQHVQGVFTSHTETKRLGFESCACKNFYNKYFVLH